jgi:cytochrome c
MAAALCAAGLAAACGPESPEEAMEGPAGGFVRAASVERGRQLFERHGCTECHGRQGQGDGPIANSLNPRPRDFRDAGAFRYGASIDELASTIAAGIRVDDRRVMPAYGHLSAGDRNSLAAYVRSLADVGEEE